MVCRLKTAAAFITAAAVMTWAGAAERDSAKGNRLIINGQPLFMSGMNIAWTHGGSFSNDVGDMPFDAFAFREHIKKVRQAGGNAVRWWLHTDAANCPKINSNGEVTGIGTRTIENIRNALDIAHEYGVVVALCLFSFDLLVPGNSGKGTSYYPGYSLENNHKFLTDSANISTYIDKALKPILAEVGSHPAIMAWEVFNEPEGMLAEENWSHVERKISMDDILRITNRIAGEVRRNTTKMTTTGVKNFNKYLPRYSDESLIAAGGDADGWLDFYMAHYYPEWYGTNASPFHNTASHWQVDRPILIGEFPGKSWPWSGYNVQPGTSMSIVDAYEYAFDNGYVGAMSWAMTDPDFGSIETTGPALQNLFAQYKDDIMIKDVEIEDPTGDLVMKLVLTGHPVLTADQMELGTNPSPELNFTGKTNVTFDMYIKEGSDVNLDIRVVLKTGGGWAWTPGPTLKLAEHEQGKWINVSVPVSSFGASADLSRVQSILFQIGATGAPFTGTIYFDNVKIDDAVISDFDDGRAWNLTGVNSSIDIVTRASVSGTSILTGNRVIGTSAHMPQITVRGKVLNVAGIDNSEMQIRLVNMRGRTVANFRATGTAQFSLSKVPAGRYIVEARIADGRAGTKAVIVK